MLLRRTLRNVRRTREIFSVLISYGFDNVVQELNLDRLYLSARRVFRRNRPSPDVVRLPQAVRLRKALEELGPTFVKMGQVLSLRPDLIPVEWADEFRQLQHNVPPVAFEKIKTQLDAEFKGRVDELFRSVDSTPIAAASMAQVHRAVLADGQEVVLKVLRPGIHDTIESDMQILHFLAGLAEDYFSNLGYSPTEVVDQFKRELEREVDLVQEGRSTEKLARAFEENAHVSFPRVFWQVTTSKVLALDEIKGVLLSHQNPENLSPEDRRSIVIHGTDAVFRQCLELGFFHADPHPGNIFARPGGKLCFIDCGMVGHVDPGTANLLADLVQGVLNQDLNSVIEVVIKLSDADPQIAENRAFRADAWEFIARFDDASLGSLQMGDLLQDFFDRVRRHRLRVPSDIVFLIKAITTIEGVGEMLDPTFDVAAHVQPHVERLVRQRYGIRAIRQRFQKSAVGYTELLETLPMQARSLLFSFRRNRLTVNLQHRGLEDLRDTIEHASNNIGQMLFIGALILGSAVLILADSVAGGPGWLSGIAAASFVAAVVMAVFHAIARRFH